jgi:hypothetical protein
MNSAAYRSWTEKSPRLRQGVMALYTRQIQLEALDETNAAAAAQAAKAAPVPPAVKPEPTVAKLVPPAPPVQKPAPSVTKPLSKEEAARAAKYAGTWTLPSSGAEFVLKDDYTATRKTTTDGKATAGRWTVDKDGQFEFTSTDGKAWTAVFLADGETLHKLHTPWRYLREKSAAVPVKTAAAEPAVTKAPEAGKPSPAAPYVGTWSMISGGSTMIIKDDHTASKTKRDDKVTGKWVVEDDGDVNVIWLGERTHFRGKLSADGQTLTATGGSGIRWIRQKP